MNVDELIYKVYKSPPIWDKRIKDHSNRGIVDDCWKKISTAMEIEEHLLKKKWKYLRDQFATEYYKKNEGQSNSSDSANVQKWQYFNQLLFMKDVIKPRRSLRNHSPASNDEDEEKPIEDLECVVLNGPDGEPVKMEDNEYHPPEVLSVSASFPTSRTVKRKRASTHETSDNKNSVVEQEQSSTLQNFSNDESDNYDLLFFQSLMPFVSKIPSRKKLRFRSRLLSLVEEFAYPNSSAGPKTKPSSDSTNSHENRPGEVEDSHTKH
ncbi:hypothetical protein LSTR_LSTR011215 [Laodelphax striatellus]|uniref:MADF domain-containing protein n=1 Tax=Laodelphax striatellus TaxID=195883 RepID=A0A482WMY4_LAOST|nr:hypothetical protein LSTR_LSTR011215 [Laodelphax striatellus]